MPRGLLSGTEVVILLVVAIVGHGVGFADVSLRASHTAICPGPRFAHIAYGMARNACSVFVIDPRASYASAAARPLMTCTPFSRSARNSLVRLAASGSTMFLTLPPGLSGHSAV